MVKKRKTSIDYMAIHHSDMPEFPEVETFRRYIEQTSLERPIIRARVKNPIIIKGANERELIDAMEGGEFLSARRHGKQLFLELSGGKWLTWHFGMTGKPVCFDSMVEEPRHNRFLFTFEDGFLAFNDPRLFGRIGIIDSPEKFIRHKGLGPDALSMTEGQFIDIFGKSRGVAKNALMDQHKLAGVGNIYSDEILFQCHLAPHADIQSLEWRDLRHIYQTMSMVLSESIRAGAKFSRLPPSYLLHHRRKGATCPLCSRTLERRTIGGRTAYFCTDCQDSRGK